jgi:hypothetical protein
MASNIPAFNEMYHQGMPNLHGLEFVLNQQNGALVSLPRVPAFHDFQRQL